MGTSVVLPAVAGAPVEGGAAGAVEAVAAEVAGPVAGRAVVAGTLGKAAGDVELQAARESAAASTTAAVLGCLPVILTVARYTPDRRRGWPGLNSQ
jgi:hypothetical protein